MFEIGPALREARERRGLAFGDVEADTAIRTRYIRALEEEQFHVLPGPTYTKGFLRAYAEYLGLDGQLFIDEFNSRHHDARAPQEQQIASQPRSRPHQRRQRRESNLVMIVLAAIVAVSALVLLATTFPNSTAPYPNSTTPTGGTSTPTTTSGNDGKTTTKNGSPERPRLTVALVLSSSTWVRVTTGSANGAGGTVAPGLIAGDLPASSGRRRSERAAACRRTRHLSLLAASRRPEIGRIGSRPATSTPTCWLRSR
jgi:cytoskeletal protein RodZ